MSQTKLASEARELTRRVYASLPERVRLAHFAVRLIVAEMSPVDIGRLFYAVFAMKGVTDMPEIKSGVTVESLGLDKAKNTNAVLRKIPRGYGTDFGRKVRAFLLKKLSGMPKVTDQQELIEDTISNALMKLSNPSTKIVGDLKKAENFALTTMWNYVVDYYRRKSTWSEGQMDVTEDGATVDFADPGSLSDFIQEMPRVEVRRFIQRLMDTASTDNQRSMINLRLQGYTDAEVARELGLSHNAVGKFFSGPAGQKMRSIIQDYI